MKSKQNSLLTKNLLPLIYSMFSFNVDYFKVSDTGAPWWWNVSKDTVEDSHQSLVSEVQRLKLL